MNPTIPAIPAIAATRKSPIPAWINALTLLIAAILAVQSYSAYLDPGLAFGDYHASDVAQQRLMTTLAGRNAVMLLLTVLALASQDARLLGWSFVMHLARESQDMFIVPYYHGFTTPRGWLTFCVFLFVFVIPEFLAVRTLRRLAVSPP